MDAASTELQDLLDAIAENATLACGADDAVIWLADRSTLHRLAHHGPIPSMAPPQIAIGRDSYVGRSLLDQATVHAHDILAETDPELAESRETAARGGWRT